MFVTLTRRSPCASLKVHETVNPQAIKRTAKLLIFLLKNARHY